MCLALPGIILSACGKTTSTSRSGRPTLVEVRNPQITIDWQQEVAPYIHLPFRLTYTVLPPLYFTGSDRSVIAVVAWKVDTGAGDIQAFSVAEFSVRKGVRPALIEYLVQNFNDIKPPGVKAILPLILPGNNTVFGVTNHWHKTEPNNTLVICASALTGPATYLAAMTISNFMLPMHLVNGEFVLDSVENTGHTNMCR